MKKKPKVLGLMGGIGSMLIGAKEAGFEIVGNIEWRKYYHTGTFEKNFPNSFMVKDLNEICSEKLNGIDLILSHPECGNWSNLNIKKSKAYSDFSDIPLFIEMVSKIKPKVFAMDNLIGSLKTFDSAWYFEKLKGYDIQIEIISNWKYGNIQKYRKRLFVIGTRKDINYRFVPGEKENDLLVRDIISDLPIDKDIPEMNHIHMNMSKESPFRNLKKPEKNLSYRELANYFKNPKMIESLIEGYPTKHPRKFPQSYKGQVWNIPYIGKDGLIRPKIGPGKLGWDHIAMTVTGGENLFHPETGLPLTIRERARIQGCPDSFIFEGEYSKLLKQTGKFMPVQFCTYLSKQIFNYLQKYERK